MRAIKKIYDHIRRFGIRGSLSLAYEKLIIDKRRYSLAARECPSFEPYTDGEASSHTLAYANARSVLYLVHHFYPARAGGTERFTLNMALSAKASGKHVTVITLDGCGESCEYERTTGGALCRRYEYSGIECIDVRLKPTPTGLLYKRIDQSNPGMRALARELVGALGVDLIHATYPQPYAAFLAEAREMKVPYILTLTDFALNCHYTTMVRKDGEPCSGSECGAACKRLCPSSIAGDTEVRYAAAREMLEGALSVAVPSDFSAKVISAEFKGARPTVIPHGISPSFKYKRRKGKPRRFLYAGGFAAHKGVGLLFDAFSRLASDDITLTVAGGGVPHIEKRLRRTKDKRISFIGGVPMEKMPELIAECDCVIVPSLYYESYNFVVREAITSGAAVVAARIGALTEAVTEGVNGALFTPGDSESLANAIMRVMELELSSLPELTLPTPDAEWRSYTDPNTK